MFNCSLNLITFRSPHLEDTLESMTLPKTAALIVKFHSCSQSFSSTLIWLTAAFCQAKQSSGKGIEEIYFGRKRMDREFWRSDSSPVDLKLCDIRIISIKCLNYLIWLKEISRIRGKFQKCYLPNISGSKTRQSFPSSNFWNAFAEKIIFCMNDLMFLLQLQLYNIFTNVLFIISKSFQ